MEPPYLASAYEYPSWILDFFAERKHKNDCKEDWESSQSGQRMWWI